MAKVTSKYQVTLPRAIADEFNIRPGDVIDWIAAGDIIRVIPTGKPVRGDDREARLRLFDQGTERVRQRGRSRARQTRSRGWSREDLYSRGRSR
jgi:AbrB family looped-hinge helix DNA binding protein